MDSDEEMLDEYVVGSPNTSYLISSLELMLREDKYFSLYDTSILSLPEEHIKKSPFEKLNSELLYKWLSFFAGIERILQTNSNLIITPEVGEEMQNLIAGTLSAIDKRKTQFKGYSSQQKEIYQRLFENLHKNEEILVRIHEQLSKYRAKTSLSMPTVYNYFLDFIKMMDGLLDLKKPSSRKSNDTDERICARAFYEMAVNGYNIAIYTRDEDIRKLVSATYKFLTSRQMKEEPNFLFLHNFSHLNIVVLKYHYEKRVFSRFFESSTDNYDGHFKLPPKSASKSKAIYENTKAILQEIENHLQINYPSQVESETMNITNPTISQEKVNKSIENLFKFLCKLQIQDNIPNYRIKVDLFKQIAILAEAVEEVSLQEEILEMKQKTEQICLNNLINHLKQEQLELEKKFQQVSQQQSHTIGIEFWQNIKTAAESSEENLRKLYFFETALKLNLYNLTEEDYQRFKEFLERFKKVGILVEKNETPIPQEKIAEAVGLSIQETIQIIEQYKIKFQSMHVYLSQATLLYFL